LNDSEDDQAGKSTDHATKPGVAEYEPATHKKVPKYFTPWETSVMLIAKPTPERRSEVRTKGHRSLSLSE
jgi:hypothetical protein